MSSFSNISSRQTLIELAESLKRESSNQAGVNQSLFDSVDEVLNTVFGKQAANIIKNHLLGRKLWSRDNFDPRQFSENLQKFLGAGASFIELEIIRNVSSNSPLGKHNE